MFVLGFDGLSGRFYSNKYPPNKNGELLYKNKPSPRVREFPYLKKWIDWIPYTNMEVFSVTSNPINNHIPYMKFEKALEMDR